MINVRLTFCLSLTSPGEWQTQFDPLVTSKGKFYLDNQNSVSVDMMKSAQYPLRLLDDRELRAQVQQLYGCNDFLTLIISTVTGKKPLHFACAGCQFPLQRKHQLSSCGTNTRQQQHVSSASQAQHL